MKPLYINMSKARFVGVRAVCLLSLLSTVAAAPIELAGLFQDGAVLQRGTMVPVWGHGEPRAEIAVQFQGQSVATTVDAFGRWKAMLQPLKASAQPAELTVASGESKIVLHNIVVGDVWFGSGQSNMAFTVSRAFDADKEIASGNHPIVRHFDVDVAVAVSPVSGLTGKWETASPSTVGSFSAVGYFFTRELSSRLGVPIGFINSSRGGTPIEAWMSQRAILADVDSVAIYQRWGESVSAFPKAYSIYEQRLEQWKVDRKKAQDGGKAFSRLPPGPPFGPNQQQTPTGLFNGMIAPLATYGIRGFVWYQGEANSPRAAEYQHLFPALIRDWRAWWGQGDLPFLYVQLPNFERRGDRTGETWAELREAQAAALAVPRTAMAVTMDIGDPKNIHPTNKQEVGRRLSLLALNRVYGIATIDSGPVLKSAARANDAIRLVFDPVSKALRASAGGLKGFELAGADRKFAAAAAEIIGADTVVMRSASVADPQYVRYAWKNAPEATLFNDVGLPAAPFRQDVK